MRLYLNRVVTDVVDIWLHNEATGYRRWTGLLNHSYLAKYGIDLKQGERVEIKIEIVEDKK